MSAQLLRIPEVATRLAVSRKHVYTLINTGQLRKTHIGPGARSTRVSEDAIAEFIAKNSTGPRRARRAS